MCFIRYMRRTANHAQEHSQQEWRMMNLKCFFQKNLLADTVDGMLSLVIDTSVFSDDKASESRNRKLI